MADRLERLNNRGRFRSPLSLSRSFFIGVPASLNISLILSSRLAVINHRFKWMIEQVTKYIHHIDSGALIIMTDRHDTR